MSEQQPELRWAPLEPKPSRAGRVWLIVGLVVAALAIIGALLFFLLPRGDAPNPSASGSPSPSSTPSPSPTATPDQTAAPTPEVTPPTPVDPSPEAFRGQVGGWLNAADRGLDIVSSAGGQDAISVIDTLQSDAQRLSDAQPPASIAQDWRDGVLAYSRALADLRTAASAGTDTSAGIASARGAVRELQTLVGL